MPPSRKRSTPSKAAEPDRLPEPTTQERTEPASAAPARDTTTFTLRLPLVTVSFARPAVRGTDAGATSPEQPSTAQRPVADASGGGQRLLFYGGVAALGVAGVVDWPVAAAIAVGTYIAARAPVAPLRSTAPARGAPPPGVPAAGA